MVPMPFLLLVLGGSTDSFVAEPNLRFFFGDDHGGEAVVGHRDAYWASSGSAVTDSLLLSAVWVVGAVFVDWNAPALGGILNQQGSVTRRCMAYADWTDVYSPIECDCIFNFDQYDRLF